MRVYRVIDRAYAAAAMNGEGAAQTGGRWNSKRVAIVYASPTLSLALLEILANAGGKIPPGKVFLPVDIPDDIHLEHLTPDALPARWYDYPAPAFLARLGDAWVKRRKTMALIVPSAIVRIENNVLLNPAHPDYARISVGGPRAIPVDTRLH